MYSTARQYKVPPTQIHHTHRDKQKKMNSVVPPEPEQLEDDNHHQTETSTAAAIATTTVNSLTNNNTQSSVINININTDEDDFLLPSSISPLPIPDPDQEEQQHIKLPPAVGGVLNSNDNNNDYGSYYWDASTMAPLNARSAVSDMSLSLFFLYIYPRIYIYPHIYSYKKRPPLPASGPTNPLRSRCGIDSPSVVGPPS